MDLVFKALSALFYGSALSTYLGGRLYNTTAPTNATYPYCVVTEVGEGPEYLLGGDGYEEYDLLFTLYAQEKSSQSIHTYKRSLTALFDDAELTYAGLTSQFIERVSGGRIEEFPQDGVWQYTIFYEGAYCE